jgi:Rieske Fe-S protein
MGVTNSDQVPTTRRAMLAGAGAAGVAVTLAACGTSPDGSSDVPTPTDPPPTTVGPVATTGGAGAIKTADIPVKGGKIFKDTDTVVTQPSAGQFKAFSATCTHAGCTVGAVSNNLINCPCHGSAYNATDGSVKNGPATKGLTAKKVTVSGDSITVS